MSEQDAMFYVVYEFSFLVCSIGAYLQVQMYRSSFSIKMHRVNSIHLLVHRKPLRLNDCLGLSVDKTRTLINILHSYTTTSINILITRILHSNQNKKLIHHSKNAQRSYICSSIQRDTRAIQYLTGQDLYPKQHPASL
jgi:ABC-type molybdate transport system ATPase subunit